MSPPTLRRPLRRLVLRRLARSPSSPPRRSEQHALDQDEAARLERELRREDRPHHQVSARVSRDAALANARPRSKLRGYAGAAHRPASRPPPFSSPPTAALSSSSPPSSPTASSPSDEPLSDETVVTVASASRVAARAARCRPCPSRPARPSSEPEPLEPDERAGGPQPSNAHRRPPRGRTRTTRVRRARDRTVPGAASRQTVRRASAAARDGRGGVRRRERDPHGAAVPGGIANVGRGPRRRASDGAVSASVSVSVSVSSPRRGRDAVRAPGPFSPPAPRLSSFRIRRHRRNPTPDRVRHARAQARGPEPTSQRPESGSPLDRPLLEAALAAQTANGGKMTPGETKRSARRGWRRDESAHTRRPRARSRRRRASGAPPAAPPPPRVPRRAARAIQGSAARETRRAHANANDDADGDEAPGLAAPVENPPAAAAASSSFPHAAPSACSAALVASATTAPNTALACSRPAIANAPRANAREATTKCAASPSATT